MNQLISHKIVQNRRVYHKYFIEKEIKSGLSLLGWEVKSIRAKKIVIDNSYVSFKNHEAYIFNSFFHNTYITSNHIYNPTRIRKLLLKKHELLFLKEKTKIYGYTIVVLDLFWKKSWVKVNIGLAKGKKKYDKRYMINSNQWKKEKRNITKYTIK